MHAAIAIQARVWLAPCCMAKFNTNQLGQVVRRRPARAFFLQDHQGEDRLQDYKRGDDSEDVESPYEEYFGYSDQDHQEWHWQRTTTPTELKAESKAVACHLIDD